MPITDAAARRFVADHYGSRVTDVDPLGAGEWSRAYAMALEGRPVVIRFGDHVADFGKDQVMAAHSCAALPIPAVTEIGAADDGYFAVSEQAPGEPLDGLDQPGLRAVLPSLSQESSPNQSRRIDQRHAASLAEQRCSLQPTACCRGALTSAGMLMTTAGRACWCPRTYWHCDLGRSR